MLHFSLRPLPAHLATAALALACLASSGQAAAADTVTRSFIVPTLSTAISGGTFSFTDENGTFIDLAGQSIVSARVSIDYRPSGDVDVTQLVMAMVVPVTGVESQVFSITGDQLVRGPFGVYHYEFTTDAYNGTLYDGRFSIEAYGLDDQGELVTMPGRLSADTGFHFEVTMPSAVPEPASWALMLAGAAGLVARKRWGRQRPGRLTPGG